jgi:hypothetical protein
LSADVKVVQKRLGSIKLKLQWTEAAAARMFWTVKNGDLEHFGVVDATMSESEDASESSGPIYADYNLLKNNLPRPKNCTTSR